MYKQIKFKKRKDKETTHEMKIITKCILNEHNV